MVTSSDRDVQWDQVARSLGALDGHGVETGGTEVARGALNSLLDPAFLEAAAHWYVLRKEGAATAWSVLMMLRPPVVMHLCVRNVRSNLPSDLRASWAKLLSEICDSSMLPVVRELIVDGDDDVRYCGTRVAIELQLRDELSDDDTEACISLFDASPHATVRAAADVLRADGYFGEGEQSE